MLNPLCIGLKCNHSYSYPSKQLYALRMAANRSKSNVYNISHIDKKKPPILTDKW